MKSDNHLESFLTTIDNQEIPDDETLKKVAVSLKAMQKGLSFKAAFKITNKRGRKPVKPISEKKLKEVKPFLDIVQEYYEMIRHGGNATKAKGYICEKHGICERIFDDYRACYNNIKKTSFLNLKPLIGKIPEWQVVAIIHKSFIEDRERDKELKAMAEEFLSYIRVQKIERQKANKIDPVYLACVEEVERTHVGLLEHIRKGEAWAQELKKEIPAF